MFEALRTKVPEEEFNRRLKAKACLNCGKAGHRMDKCRSRFSEKHPLRNKIAAALLAEPSSPPAAPATPPTPPPMAPTVPSESINRMCMLMEKLLQTQVSPSLSSLSSSAPQSGF